MSKQEKLEEIANETGALGFTSWLLETSGLPEREIAQSYMVWKFKWNWGIENSATAWETWCDSGMAKAFALEYPKTQSVSDLYKSLVAYERAHFGMQGYLSRDSAQLQFEFEK